MAGDGNSLDPSIEGALDKVFGASIGESPEMLRRMRNLIVNCLSDNYDQSDVRALIELAVDGNEPPKGGE